MKALLWTIIGLVAINMFVLLVNVLYSNTILATITTISFFTTLIWLLKKGLTLGD